MSKCIYFASCKKRKFANKKVSISCTIFLALTLVYKGMLLKPSVKARKFLVLGFLGFSCSSYCDQIPSFRQELPPGSPGFFWNTTPDFPRKPRIYVPFQAFQSQIKHEKAKKARSQGVFLGLRAFSCRGS